MSIMIHVSRYMSCGHTRNRSPGLLSGRTKKINVGEQAYLLGRRYMVLIEAYNEASRQKWDGRSGEAISIDTARVVKS